MKKKLFLAITVLFIVSCSSDSSSSNSTNLLIGKWTVEFEKEYSSAGVLTNTYDHSEENCYHMTIIEFKTNNQVIKDSYDYTGVNCERNPIRNYTWSKSGNILNIDNDVLEIIENTTNDLKLKIVNSDNQYTVFEYSRVD